uniref:AB hydrolase-1 domain-containing protein n=1 Tax=Syphacia muris TaxID=451379 RepID=A0A0N5ANW2_9BILA
MFLRTIWDCICGPRLYAIYSTVPRAYDCNVTEGISILMFMFINGLRYVIMPFSPFVISGLPPIFKAKSIERIYIKGHIPVISNYFRSVYDLLAYWCVNSFGRQMAYPGATALCKTLWFNMMNVNRMKVIFEQKGQRNLVGTIDGNVIDTVFVDRRGITGYGDFLVITCEGNAGCYEFGIMGTPLSLGFSVLGWNIPGFGESTGTPFPMEILNGMDSVMQFAINFLGFREEKIIIFSWSIGCFPGTWAAANFPNIQSLILDAGFDDLLPLAFARTPASVKFIVEYTVRKYLNLPVLALYHGPVTLIRRLLDDIVVTGRTENSSETLPYNRANELLKTLFSSRHKPIYNGKFDREKLSPVTFKNLSELDRTELLDRACGQYLLDFKADHHTPLSSKFFDIHLSRAGVV